MTDISIVMTIALIQKSGSKDIDLNGIGDACDPNTAELLSGINVYDLDVVNYNQIPNLVF